MDSMPRTRELIGAHGLTLSQHVVPLSLCCPSRATILTGLYPHNHHVYTNNADAGGYKKFDDLGLEAKTAAVGLHAAGYRTVLLGKYLNGYPRQGGRLHLPPGWDDFESPIGGSPYDGFHYFLNENGKSVEYRR